MPTHRSGEASVLATLATKPAFALRQTLREGYGPKDLTADVLAGIVVGMVALPLAMALAVASGVPPQFGLYTSIVAGAVIALLGGSRVQVSGPTAAFIVVLAPVSAKFGVGGLLVATAMAGVLLVAMGLARLGRQIEFIPYPVTTGFTAGVAVVIATTQVEDFLGLQLAEHPVHWIERVGAISGALPTLRASDLGIGVLTLAILLLWPRVTRKVPAPLVALGAGAVVAEILRHAGSSFEVATIGSRFHYVLGGATHAGIPPLPPLPVLPWSLPGPGGVPFALDYATLRALAPSAFAIAMLGAIESLLSAVVADGMTGRKHDPDAELLAQGVGNLVAPFFGGIAATGAIARTATNVRSGARSPVAAIVHALFVLAGVVVLAPALGFLPMASLAALLLLVAWNMSEVKHFAHIVRVAPKSDVLVLLACFSLTVVFDMVVAVTFGVMLSALLFMKRMAEVANARLVNGDLRAHDDPLPPGVLLYEIAGPLFFGAAQKAMGALARTDARQKTVILDVEHVPVIDVTGLVALESALERLWKGQAFVVLAGVQDQPAGVLAKAGIVDREGRLAICRSYEDGLALARERAAASAA